MSLRLIDCPVCGCVVGTYRDRHGELRIHSHGEPPDGCSASTQFVSSRSVGADRRVTIELDARDAELVGMSLQLLARDHKSPDLTVAARLQRVGDALRRAAKIEATVEALEQREVLS